MKRIVGDVMTKKWAEEKAQKPKKISGECWIVKGCKGWDGTNWIVRVFWGRNAQAKAVEHAASATEHDKGLVVEYHRELGEWSSLPLHPVTGEPETPAPKKGLNKFDPDRPTHEGYAIDYTVERAHFTRLF